MLQTSTKSLPSRLDKLVQPSYALIVQVRSLATPRGGWNVDNCHMTATRLEFF